MSIVISNCNGEGGGRMGVMGREGVGWMKGGGMGLTSPVDTMHHGSAKDARYNRE